MPQYLFLSIFSLDMYVFVAKIMITNFIIISSSINSVILKWETKQQSQ